MTPSERERMRMSTAQLKIVTEHTHKIRWFELTGVIVLVVLDILARLVEKYWGISVVEAMLALGWFTGKLTGKPANQVIDHIVQSLPPKRLENLYQHVMSYRPPPTPRVPAMPTDAQITQPIKHQPHHRPRTPPK